jgi:PQQ enzyme repeat
VKTAFAFLFLIAIAGTFWPSRGVSEEHLVLTYHTHPDRSGNFIVPALTWVRSRALRLDVAFHAQVSGQVYAQPLYWREAGSISSMLLIATEDNIVYALDAVTGKEIWSRSLGKSVPLSLLRCGNIDPIGITGTPVIDKSTASIFLDAMVNGSSGPRHQIFGISLRDGSFLPGWPVDVANALQANGQTFNPRDQGQRGALTIIGGVLYVPFGGHFGDCGDYHGWVIGISLHDPQVVASWATRARGGGIWAPGGISTDGKSLFVATGNTIDTAAWADGEAIFRLFPDLRRVDQTQDHFAPLDWYELDRRDADLGGTNPLPLDVPTESGTQALVLALGKDGRAYLLDRNDLGGIGGSLVAEPVSNRAIRTAPVTYPTADGVFVAFQGEGARCPTSSKAQTGLIGLWLNQINDLRIFHAIRRWLKVDANELTVLKVRSGSPPTIETAWCGTLRGAGSPIVTTTDGRSDPVIWIVGAEGDNLLHGFKGDTGETLYTGDGVAMAGLHHFQTLIATDDRLYVSADGRIFAFAF